MPAYLFSFLLSVATANSACPDNYAQLMHLFGRSVRQLGEWAERPKMESKDEILNTLRQARRCAELSAQGDHEALLPRGYNSHMLERHTHHLGVFVALLSEAERSLCEATLSRDGIRNIEQKLWRAAHAAHDELFAGKSR